jgi:hypothetical protein
VPDGSGFIRFDVIFDSVAQPFPGSRRLNLKTVFEPLIDANLR